MLLRHLGLLIFMAGSVTLVGCSDLGNPIGPGSPDVVVRGFGTTVSYRSDIRAIFAARCDQACHTHIFRDPATAYANLLNVDFGYVIPFDPDNSGLYFLIVTGQMPQGGPTLPQAEQNKFRDWILEGATDN